MSNTEYEEITIFRCTECGKVKLNLGSLHAHCERHRGLFGLQWPWRYGDYDALMEMTEPLRVTDAEPASVDEVMRS